MYAAWQSASVSDTEDFDHQPIEKIRLFDAYRYVRSDDHELTFSLTLIKFTYKPVITFLVKRAMPIDRRTDLGSSSLWVSSSTMTLIGILDFGSKL